MEVFLSGALGVPTASVPAKVIATQPDLGKEEAIAVPSPGGATGGGRLADLQGRRPDPDLNATDVKLHYDAMSNTIVSSVVDKESGVVVTEMPPEALRALAARTAEFRGRIFDMKA